jgi:L-ascorbate metabolism protein UlaG (beta-lactamase superfamily)
MRWCDARAPRAVPAGGEETELRLIKYSHSCVRLEGDGVVVIDPGGFSEAESLDGADAVLITHEHADHLDQGKLADALARRPTVTVYTNPDCAKLLTELAGVVQTVVAGDTFTAAGFTTRVYGGLHAIVHPELPRVANVGFLVEGTDGSGAVYHPGDSFDVPTGADVDTLFVPSSGPWLKFSEAVDFVRAVRPRRAYALHDALASENGHALWGGNMNRLAGCPYERLTPGTRA